MARPGEPTALFSDAATLLAPYLIEPGRATGAVLAVSGGPDSVALMRLAAEMQREVLTVPITVVTVDHGLRPNSRDEADAVAGWAASLGLPHRVLTWDGPKPRTRVQEAAREVRYLLLAEFARKIGASHVLTAHTLDDQAETVLMRLARGSGVAGLAAMRVEAARHGIVLARPFLSLRKARLVAACRAEGWPFLEDPSNADPRFTRARLRQLLPMLEQEGLTPERLAALALRAQRTEKALNSRADAVLAGMIRNNDEGRLELDGVGLVAEPDEIVLRVLARAIAVIVGEPAPAIRLERLERFALRDLRPALAGGSALRSNFAGALLQVAHDGRLILRPEPPRRRGRTKVFAQSVKTNQNASAREAVIMPHSLGKGESRA